MMRTLVVYFTKFGNTQKVAEAIAESMQTKGAARLLSADKLTSADLEDVDLVIMGTPTHKMNLPEAVRPVFERLPRRILRGTPFATFDTSYKMSAILSRFTAAKRLSQKLKKLGGRRIVPPETFHVEGREGPMFEGEFDRAREWASGILERMNGRPVR